MAPSSLFSRLSKLSNTRERTLSTSSPRPSDASFQSRSRSPSPTPSSKSSKRPAHSATASGALTPSTSVTTPTVVLTTDSSESPILPSTPGSLHRRSSMGSINGDRSRSNSPLPPAFVNNSDSKKSYPKLLDINGNGPKPRSSLQDDLPTPRAATAAETAEPFTTPLARKASPSFTSSQNKSPSSMDVPTVSPAPIRSRPPSLNLEEVRQRLSHKDSEQSIRSTGHRSSVGSSDNGIGPNVIVDSPELIAPARSRANTTSTSDPNVALQQLADLNRVSSINSVRSDPSSIKSGKKSKKDQDKDKPWRRPSMSASKKKPTGIASALAASGMTLAQYSTPQSIPPIPRIPSMVPISSPASSKGRSREPSTSLSVSNGTNGDDSDEGYDSTDALSFNEEDIPITGFAVASSKRNADFHELFPDVPDGDYLIEDYGCALQRDILVQGRIYISENHMCFHANIFGWVTNVVLPFTEITSLEKKMTAFVIPNAIQVATIDPNQKYTFASFLSRDTTFDVIHNIWRLSHPHSPVSQSSVPRATEDDSSVSSASSAPGVVSPPVTSDGLQRRHKATVCACGKDGSHFSETALNCVLPGTPEKIYNLIFASGFIKEFMSNNQKLMAIQISDWHPESSGSHLLTRNMSYIKPLGGGLGPKQTKCEIKDETLHVDFEDYVSTMTTTRTPDVPSGGVFAVKTRTCMMWAGPASTKVLVTTTVEWTGRSFIKTIIERSALEGQRTYHADLERAILSYVAAHKTEFLQGQTEEEAAMVERQTSTEISPEGLVAATPAADRPMPKRHDAEQRSLQWALDTATSALKLTKQSFLGLIDIVGDVAASGSMPSPWVLIIVGLVISNIWTMVSLRQARKRDEMTKRRLNDGVGTGSKKIGDQERIANEALQEFLEGLVKNAKLPTRFESESSEWAVEVQRIDNGISELERRVERLRDRLSEVKVEGQIWRVEETVTLNDLD